MVQILDIQECAFCKHQLNVINLNCKRKNINTHMKFFKISTLKFFHIGLQALEFQRI